MKPNIPYQKKAYNALNSRLGNYMAQVQSIYDRISLQLASAIDLVDYDGATEFLFSNYPELSSIVSNIMTDYISQMNSLIYAGTTDEWKQSNLMQDLLARKVLKAYDFEKGGDKYNRYFQTNSSALKAFQSRVDYGMDLSQRLWNQAENLKREMELTISTAIDRGQSAVVLSKRLSKYLNDFPSLRNDYTEKFGKAIDCKDCQYASMRLARSEINMAYREAERLRWQQFDFILGFEVKLSKSHPAPDICDDLKGKYPKDFKFVGWHPNCMCYVVPIVMTDSEYYGNGVSDRLVSDVPNKYKLWVRNNEDRIANWKSLPYFLKDNPSWRDYLSLDYHRLSNGKYAKVEKELVRNLRRQMYEKFCVFKNGKKVIDASGNFGNVFFDDEMAKKCKDCTLIHNHPNGGRNFSDIRAVGHSLSSDDVKEAVSCNMYSMVAITQTYRYEMVRPATGWGASASDMKKAYGKIYDEIVDRYKNQLTEERSIIVQHLTMKELAKRYKFEYRSVKK